jgi:hypothetical protein
MGKIKITKSEKAQMNLLMLFRIPMILSAQNSRNRITGRRRRGQLRPGFIARRFDTPQTVLPPVRLLPQS